MKKEKKAIQTHDLVDKVILETGKSRDDVINIINSFIGNLKRAASSGDVYIRRFGLFSSEIKKRHYFDINNRQSGPNVFSISPKIYFKPAPSFLDRVRLSRKEEIDKLEKSYGT
jgi:nucleoid DNA-binding protein